MMDGKAQKISDSQCTIQKSCNARCRYTSCNSTDTVFNPNIIGQEKFKTVSVAPMFAETLMRYYRHDSINQMFSQLPDHVIEAGLDLAGLKL